MTPKKKTGGPGKERKKFRRFQNSLKQEEEPLENRSDYFGKKKKTVVSFYLTGMSMRMALGHGESKSQ